MVDGQRPRAAQDEVDQRAGPQQVVRDSSADRRRAGSPGSCRAWRRRRAASPGRRPGESARSAPQPSPDRRQAPAAAREPDTPRGTAAAWCPSFASFVCAERQNTRPMPKRMSSGAMAKGIRSKSASAFRKRVAMPFRGIDVGIVVLVIFVSRTSGLIRGIPCGYRRSNRGQGGRSWRPAICRHGRGPGPADRSGTPNRR